MNPDGQYRGPIGHSENGHVHAFPNVYPAQAPSTQAFYNRSPQFRQPEQPIPPPSHINAFIYQTARSNARPCHRPAYCPPYNYHCHPPLDFPRTFSSNLSNGPQYFSELHTPSIHRGYVDQWNGQYSWASLEHAPWIQGHFAQPSSQYGAVYFAWVPQFPIKSDPTLGATQGQFPVAFAQTQPVVARQEDSFTKQITGDFALWKPAQKQKVLIRDPCPPQAELRHPTPIRLTKNTAIAGPTPVRTGFTPDTLSTKPVPINFVVLSEAETRMKQSVHRDTRRDPQTTVNDAASVGSDTYMTSKLERPRLFRGREGEVAKYKSLTQSGLNYRPFRGPKTTFPPAGKQHGVLALLYQEHEEELDRLAKARDLEEPFWTVWE